MWPNVEPMIDKYERLIETIEHRREIMSRYAKLRTNMIGNTIPQVIVQFDDNDVLVDIRCVYPPNIESALKEIDYMETLELNELDGKHNDYRIFRQY